MVSELMVNMKSSSTSSVYCQLCDKEGHLAKHCWSFLKLKKKQSAHLAEAFSACSIQELNNPEWFPDSGVTSHMTNNPDNLDDPAICSGNERVMVGNGQSLPISHIGSVSTVAPHSFIPLSNVLVVPGIKKNLISISQLTKQINYRVIFDSFRLIIQDRVTERCWGSVDVRMVSMSSISIIMLLFQFCLPINRVPLLSCGMHALAIPIIVLFLLFPD
jgi:hypothetical protein